MHVALSPALPSELLDYIVSHCAYPTTLVVCAFKDEFVRVCVEEGEGEGEGDDDDDDDERGDGDGDDDGDRDNRNNKPKIKSKNTHNPRWASVSLLQVAVARHIRVAFVPTVAHLRAFLAAFDLAAGPVSPPPDPQAVSSFSSSLPPLPRPRLLIYGFVALHHDTSEWSAQGLGASAAVLVEAAWRAGWDAVLVEGRRGRRRRGDNPWDDAFPAQTLPVLSTVPRRQLQRAGYPSRTCPVRSVLARWFRFRSGPWEKKVAESAKKKEAEGESEGEPKEPPVETLQNEGPSTRPAARAYVKDSEDEEDAVEDEDQHDNENDPT